MQYLIVFLEGIITFISPCLLPMLPIYVSYFAGSEAQDTQKTLLHAFGFVLGFTLVFMALGALAGTLGSFLTAYQNVVNLVCGLIVIFFGLHFLGVFQLNLFRGSRKAIRTRNLGFFSAMVLHSRFFSSSAPPDIFSRRYFVILSYRTVLHKAPNTKSHPP